MGFKYFIAFVHEDASPLTRQLVSAGVGGITPSQVKGSGSRRRGKTPPTGIRALAMSGLAALAALPAAYAADTAGDIERGRRLARACLGCHSFAPGNHMTGPSLAGFLGRKAGASPGFGRYSKALRDSELVWDRHNLDAWLRSPETLVPGNAMAFDGIADAGARQDLAAYLRAASEGRVAAADRRLPNLKLAEDSQRVKSIHYCGDAYRLTTADGRTHTLWEFNVRFKTDGSASGPPAGQPVIVGTGMQGDRVAIVFARPEELARAVHRDCP
jgi:cytochrome c